MKTRIKRIFTSLPFIVGVFVVVYAGFGMVYYQKHAESRQIEARTAPARIILERPAPNLAELEERLNKARAELDAEWASLPETKMAIELYDALVVVAVENNVDLKSITASQPVGSTLGNVGYSILPYNVSLEGSQNNILSFISSLADGPGLLASSEINNVNLSSSVSSNTTEETVSTTANIQIHVYTRPN